MGSINHRFLEPNISEHAGFCVTGGNLYASCADGVEQHYEEIVPSLPDGQFYKFSIILLSNKAYFYVNDELKATVTSRVPDGASGAAEIFVASVYSFGGVAMDTYLYNVRFFQDGTVKKPWEAP